ncbi:hypothetical protein C8R44DRAFT_808706 [Mycena epipterygia]|nr:hypothetical protein C8R44DRAFT_808706 [Mycena epipterygia]
MSSLATAVLIEAFVEIFFYGVYVVLFATVMYLSRSRHGLIPEKRPIRWLLLGLCVQFLIITAHWIDTIYRACFGFLHLGGGTAAEVFYLDQSAPYAVADVTLFVICTLVTDILVIHRLYVISSHRLNIIVFPLTALMGQTGASLTQNGCCHLLCFATVGGAGIIYRFVKSLPGDNSYSLSNGWVTTALVSSIVISMYSSAMISWKICRISKALNRLSEHLSGGMRLTSVLAILVESAVLQSVATIAILISFQFGFVGQLVWEGIAPVIFGISTILIHVRIGLGWAHDADGQANSNPTRIHFAANELEEEHELEQRGRK